MTAKAGVSERDFRSIFADGEQCYRAACEQGLDRLARAVSAAVERERGWLERLRAGLVALLGFLDDEPALARLLVLEQTASGALPFAYERQLGDMLARLLERESDGGDPATRLPAMTEDLIAGGVFAVIRTSMLEDGDGALVELAPSLMAFIVTPYLGQAGARAELEGRPANGISAPASAGVAGADKRTRARAISRAAQLPIRATHRTTLVLRAIGQAPYSNNREVAQAAGIADEGQTSKLLARLERQGVIENVGIGATRGEPNAWLLTRAGRRTVELIGETFADGAPRPRGARIRGAA